MASLKDLIVTGPARFLDKLYGNLEGNATTATKLATARTINGTSFDGSSNITTANWGTARTLTIGNTGKSVNGSGNVSWTLAEIGATVSNAWEAGTSAGPKIKTTVNGVTGAAVEIPVATASTSGVVTNTAQTFAGNKMFNGDILLHMGDSDRSIVFSYSNSTTISPSASWRIAGLGSGTSDTNYFVIQSGTSSTAGTETWNNVVRIGQNTFDIALGGNVYPLTNNSKSLGTSSYQWKDAWFSGTVTITKTQDASGTVDSKPALIVGGLSTAAHLELDNNELMAKTNGTSVAELYLNSNGGLVHIGSGGLQIDESNILAYSSSTTDRSVKVQNSNGIVGIYTSTNRGLYDFTKGEWIIYRTQGNSTTLIPNWGTKGSSSLPVYFSGGQPTACSSTLGVSITGNAATASALAYPAQIATQADLDAFKESGKFKTGYWNSFTPTSLFSNGIILSGGWTSDNFGFQIAIDDDPTWKIALRQKSTTWSDWKYIPMADGTNASGTWGISITGNAATATAFSSSRTIALTGAVSGSVSGNGSSGWSIATTIAGKTITPTNFTTTFRTQTKGDANAGTYFSVIRSNTTDSWGHMPQWSSGIAFGQSDTHGYLYINYSSAAAYIGGGSADKLNWTKNIAFGDGTGASGTWGINVTGSAGSVAWGNVTGKPSTFSPSSHTHNYLTAGSEGATASVRTADRTTALITGGWGSTSAGYLTQYGTTLDVSGYSTWYHRLAFNTSGHIEYWHGINTKTLTKIGYLYTTQNIVYSSQQPTSNLVHGMIWLYPA